MNNQMNKLDTPLGRELRKYRENKFANRDNNDINNNRDNNRSNNDKNGFDLTGNKRTDVNGDDNVVQGAESERQRERTRR